jgi:hypothetical protein
MIRLGSCNIPVLHFCRADSWLALIMLALASLPIAVDARSRFCLSRSADRVGRPRCFPNKPPTHLGTRPPASKSP